MTALTHINKQGKATMVDVGNKPVQVRIARAEGFIALQPETIKLIGAHAMKKGDVLTVSEIAGIQAAKRTSDLIPLCHPLQIVKIDVNSSLTEKGVAVSAMVKSIGQTGVEMEALTAVQVALLNVYDMCKAVDKTMVMQDIHLVSKTKTDLK
ncbi:MAG TPA: cyclic pyranopterin monophosphate synthase MoaC [Bacteroidetes bacterium]|nr:cyclic pyranopterin monophosphate synthase MoaC [Bacteroidota bacterium]